MQCFLVFDSACLLHLLKYGLFHLHDTTGKYIGSKNGITPKNY